MRERAPRSAARSRWNGGPRAGHASSPDCPSGGRRHDRAALPAPASTIRVLIADDHAAFRGGLRALLATAADIEVVGEAASGVDAVAEAERLQPDVVLMDVNMPGIDGVEATRRIVDASPHVAVLVLTMHDDDETVFEAVRAGARGYLLKGAQRVELVRAIRAVAAGEAIFGPGVARRLMAFFARPRRASIRRPSPS